VGGGRRYPARSRRDDPRGKAWNQPRSPCGHGQLQSLGEGRFYWHERHRTVSRASGRCRPRGDTRCSWKSGAVTQDRKARDDLIVFRWADAMETDVTPACARAVARRPVRAMP